jgi:antitoxin VapB
MPLNIKDPEAERLAAEVAALTGESKTGAVRTALRERKQRLLRASGPGRAAIFRGHFAELWAEAPPGIVGVPLSKDEQERILGIGTEGV